LIEFRKNYDFGLTYHLEKEDVVVDALSRNTAVYASFATKQITMLEQFKDLSSGFELMDKSVKLGMLKITSDLCKSSRSLLVTEKAKTSHCSRKRK